MGKKDLEQNISMDELLQQQVEENIEGASASDLVSLIAIDNLTNTDKIKMTSRLKEEQILNISKLLLFTDVYGTNFTSNLANYIMQLQVSIRGLGRKELVKVVNQSISEEPIKKSMFDRKDPFR